MTSCLRKSLGLALTWTLATCASGRTFQDIEADSAKLVDVGVEDLGQETNLGCRHGIVIWEEEL